MSPTATEPEAPNVAPDDIFLEEETTQTAPPNLWDGREGLAVTIFGILLPSLVISVGSVICFERIMRLVFKHPVETLLECTFVILVPAANYYAWNAIRNQDGRHPLRIGLLNGAAIATSLAIAGVSSASVFFDYPEAFMMLAAISGLAAITSLYIGIRLRNSAGTRQGRANRVLFSGLGVLLSVAGLAACEAKGTAIRIAETAALSDIPAERDRGLSMLRQLNCEQDLRMQCADSRAAGIPGLFWRISPERERELYFAVMGKPYGNSLTDSVYSMSDEYLQRHVVGTPVKGLNLRRSQMAGHINPETLTATVNWTFVFKNNSFENQEARAEIAVPPGAVISDLTMWQDGSARPATIGPTDRAQRENISNDAFQKYTWVDLSDVDPALITDLGRGRVLLKCSPVPAQGEAKVQVTFTERLKPVGLTQASMVLPKFVDANFAFNGDHSLRLHSADIISAPAEMKTLRAHGAADGGTLLVGNLHEADLNGGNLNVSLKRPATMGPFFIKEPSGNYVKETIKQVATSAPQHLVVVVDNSQSMAGHVDELIDSLKKMPPNVKASVVLPTDGQQMEPVDLQQGIELIRKAKFDGGKDNLQAVIKAAEVAGETRNGAVLWIHGPQPGFNQEMYIMAPYIERPAFYELALDDRWTDTNEFFKNHREIGPFMPIARAGSVMGDLQAFLSTWRSGGTTFVVQLDRTNEQPDCKQVIGTAADELTKLAARDECYVLLRGDQLAAAADLATAARIVTPVTGAAVLHRQIARTSPTDAFQTAWVQGATNGSIGPSEYQQHQNAVTQSQTEKYAVTGTSTTVIAGINTAGTVRVNNLANLEALLNFIANAFEILGLGTAAGLIISGGWNCLAGNAGAKNSAMRVALGVAIGMGALSVPGTINWLVASARDANLFS